MRVDVCVIGAGPAGASIAARLAALGHDVVLVERSRFPRPHVGEALTPGALPQLELIGARGRIEAAGFLATRGAIVCWRDEDRPMERSVPGFVVDRGRFDAILLDVAARAGVTVLQPASARRPTRDGGAWRLRVAAPDRTVDLRARFLVDATGGSGLLGAPGRRLAPATLALHAHIAGAPLPAAQHVETGADGWYWASPRPDGTFSVMVFTDAGSLAGAGGAGGAQGTFVQHLGRSRLLRGCATAALATPVRVCDATPRAADDPSGDGYLRVGDAALALDPLSSTGVEKALQTALAGAAVIHTILRRPADAALARAFHDERHRAAVELHTSRTAAHYVEPRRHADRPFWRDRGRAGPLPPEREAPLRHALPHSLAAPVVVSPAAALIETACIAGDFIELRRAVSHPHLERPVAFVGGVEVAPLLDRIIERGALADALSAAPGAPPIAEWLPLVAWLFERGILVPGARR